MRIGVLEDDPALCVMVQEMLEIKGHTISTYHDGAALVRALQQEEPADLLPPFDLLLVDLILPGTLSGEQVIAHVRRTYSTLPLVILSAAPSSQLEDVLRSYAGVKALRKPFKLRNLHAAIAGEDTFG